MILFNAVVHTPFSDEPLVVSGCEMVVATATMNDPELQLLAKEFSLSVTENTVIVETLRSDGRLLRARLLFDGDRIVLTTGN